MALAKQSRPAPTFGRDDLPKGGVWISKARADAYGRLADMGLPTRRDEYWRFTNPADLVADPAPQAAVFQSDEAPVFDGIDRLKLVFVDGVFDPDQSDDPAMGGITLDRLADAQALDIHWAGGLFGTLEAEGQTPVPRPLTALNTAMATDGMLIHVTGKAQKPVSLVYLRSSETAEAILHHVVKLDPGADLTLLENGPGAARMNTVLEVDVADGASFHHVRAQGRDHERRAATAMFARLGRESSFKSFTLTVNGALTRNEAFITFNGDDSHATVAGAAAGDGAFHHDDTVFVTHDAERCESRQVFKKVLRNGATGVFQGKILVRDGAQKTDGYQISQGLMLDDDSQFLAKPELEIYADDVACSHGSTVGAIDEDALFYLTSRGVPRRTAQNMLVLAFLAEAIEEVEDEALAADMLARLEGWTERHQG